MIKWSNIFFFDIIEKSKRKKKKLEHLLIRQNNTLIIIDNMMHMAGGWCWGRAEAVGGVLRDGVAGGGGAGFRSHVLKCKLLLVPNRDQRCICFEKIPPLCPPVSLLINCFHLGLFPVHLRHIKLFKYPKLFCNKMWFMKYHMIVAKQRG